jgi:hypothetical protein
MNLGQQMAYYGLKIVTAPLMVFQDTLLDMFHYTIVTGLNQLVCRPTNMW